MCEIGRPRVCFVYLCLLSRGRALQMKRRDFMLAAGATIGLAIMRSTAKASVPRPRLLISKTDPFTGLALLKTRYQLGMRPSDDMEGWALSWQLTGDKAFAEKALQRHANESSRKRGKAFAFLGRLRAVVVDIRLAF